MNLFHSHGVSIVYPTNSVPSNGEIACGDCLEILAFLPDNSVDSIVTDPPYGLGFMGKHWDHGVPGVDFWIEMLRVLKPGGHLLSFGGSRTYHRMASAIEDAGFEIRDQIMWLYGSGFPKSLDVSKAIDKAAGAEREVVGFDATDAAKHWQGWGTALKPAHEPIVMARKPLIGTVAANVLTHGTGALNIDGCRVGYEEDCRLLKGGSYGGNRAGSSGDSIFGTGGNSTSYVGGLPLGRWPANIIHDGSDEVLEAFPQAPGQQGKSSDSQRSRANTYGDLSDNGKEYEPRGDAGSAARFFYVAKAGKADRHEGLEDPGHQFKHGDTLRKIENTETRGNNHPTVKPTDLMRYLCRLITPAGGIVLDPFMGSGSTGKAAVREGFQFLGIEREAEYFEIAKARIK